MPNDCHISADQIGVCFSGGHLAVQNVSLDCPPGRFLSLVGPSGCGKSTLLRCLAGLQVPTSGRLHFRSSDDRPPRRAYVFQDPHLLPWRNVRDNVALPLELAGHAAGLRRQAAEDTMRVTGLAIGDSDKRPRMLSGGMRMRVSLARALVTQPALMLLDEPFAALDDISRQQLNEELIRLWMQQGWTAVFITHNVAEAVFLGEQVLVMSQRPGQIIAEVSVPFTYPRRAELRGTPEFALLSGVVADHLRSAAHAA
jgi:NitT/TauT family transport system ATP-binding protein